MRSGRSRVHGSRRTAPVRPETDAFAVSGALTGVLAAVEADDVTVKDAGVTVKGASSSIVNRRRMDRIYLQAVRAGIPLIHFGENRGGRMPQEIGS